MAKIYCRTKRFSKSLIKSHGMLLTTKYELRLRYFDTEVVHQPKDYLPGPLYLDRIGLLRDGSLIKM